MFRREVEARQRCHNRTISVQLTSTGSISLCRGFAPRGEALGYQDEHRGGSQQQHRKKYDDVPLANYSHARCVIECECWCTNMEFYAYVNKCVCEYVRVSANALHTMCEGSP